MQRFYVYVYLDPRIPGRFCYKDVTFLYKPFYVGKGTGNRYKVHIMEAKAKKLYCRPNMRKIHTIRHILTQNPSPYIVFMCNNVSRYNALEYEVALIRDIGRVESGGPLTNLTEGGEGSTGNIHTDAAKIKMSLNHYKCSGVNNSMYGKNHTLDSKMKMSLNKKGKYLGVNCKNSHTYTIVDPIGNIYTIKQGLLDFCKLHNISMGMTVRTLKSGLPCKRGKSRGWRCISSVRSASLKI